MKLKPLFAAGVLCIALFAVFWSLRVSGSRHNLENLESKDSRASAKASGRQHSDIKGLVARILKCAELGSDAECRNEELNVSFDDLLDASDVIFKSSNEQHVKSDALDTIFRSLARRDLKKALEFLDALKGRHPQNELVWPDRTTMLDFCNENPIALVDWLQKNPEYSGTGSERSWFYQDVIFALSQHNLSQALSAGQELNLPKAKILASAARGVNSFADRSYLLSETENMVSQDMKSGVGELDIQQARHRIVTALGEGLTNNSLVDVGEWLLTVSLTDREICDMMMSAKPPEDEVERDSWYRWMSINLGESYRVELERAWNAQLRYR